MQNRENRPFFKILNYSEMTYSKSMKFIQQHRIINPLHLRYFPNFSDNYFFSQKTFLGKSKILQTLHPLKFYVDITRTWTIRKWKNYRIHGFLLIGFIVICFTLNGYKDTHFLYILSSIFISTCQQKSIWQVVVKS